MVWLLVSKIISKLFQMSVVDICAHCAQRCEGGSKFLWKESGVKIIFLVMIQLHVLLPQHGAGKRKKHFGHIYLPLSS